MSSPFDPVPTPDTLPFWQAAKERRLSIQICNACERYFFYPRNGCPNCGATDIVWRDVSGRGRLVSYVINHQPLPPANPGEVQVIAVVELEERVRMLSAIVGVEPVPEVLSLGIDLTVDFAPSGEWMLPVFRLAGAA